MPDVRAATPADRAELLTLIREMIPGVDAEARWRWLYERNPGGPALSWLAGIDGQTVGCTSFFPFRLWLDGAIVLAALGGDGYVRPAARRNGVGSALHRASRDAMHAYRLGCMYGAPAALNVTPLKRGGSVVVGDVVRWVRPIRPAALGLHSRLLARLAVAPSHTPDLEPMQRHDERVDEIWLAARRELRLAAVRDAAFYTWRFLDAPAGRQRAFVIVERGAPIGACAVEVTRGGTVLTVLDLIAIPGAWHAGLRAIVRYAAEHTAANLVDLKLLADDGRHRPLWRCGFTERERKPFLCMIPPGGDRRFLDPQRWCYTGADSDLDTLEPLDTVAAPHGGLVSAPHDRQARHG